MRALWDTFKLKPKNKYSLEHLKYLYSILIKNPLINEQNRSVIIETLRQIAELLIWGDQHNAGFLDFFLEKNLLGFFINILSQRTNKTVKIQLIQTLSILVENLKSKDAIYYLFSNNHINEFIIHRFDFSDEELLAYYISFLKTLSLKLDRSTVQFFFNSVDNDFPLYTEAIKFFNHEESMIRIAVRTLTLNVYKVEDELMRNYILASTAVPYFANIVWFIRQQCLNLDAMVVKSNHETRRRLDDYVDELLDQLYYLHDIFILNIDQMSSVLAEHMMKCLLVPLFIGSLAPDAQNEEAVTGGAPEDRISHVLALFLLAQVFNIFQYKPLVNALAAALIHPSPAADYTPLLHTKPTPPPSLSILSKHASYPFRRFASVPNLEQLERNALPSNNTEPNQPPAKTGLFSLPTLMSRSSSSVSLESMSSPKEYHTAPPSLSQSHSGITDTTNNTNTNNPSNTTNAQNNTINPTTASSPFSLTSLLLTPTIGKGRRRNLIKEALLSNFDDDRTALAVVCLLYTMVKNQAVDRELLEIGGLFPYRLSRAKYLLEMLTGTSNAVSEFSPQNNAPISVSNFNNLNHPRSKSESHVFPNVHALLANTERGETGNNDVNDTNNNASIPSEQENSPIDVNITVSGTTDIDQDSHVKEADLSIEEKTGEVVESKNDDANLGDEVKDTTKQNGKKRRTRRTKLENGNNTSSNENDESSGIVTVPESQQREFSREVIGKLLHILVRSSQFRLVTLQMTLLMLKELVYSPDSPPRLTHRQLLLLGEAYANAIECIKEVLSGVLGDIFLELFEEDLRTYRQVNFDHLIKDASLLLPVSGTPMSRLDLTRRLPSGEAEKAQKAIQQFLVLRELKLTLSRKKDDLLPLKQLPIPSISLKDSITIIMDPSAENTRAITTTSTTSEITTIIPFSVGAVHPKDKTKRIRRYMALYPQVLVAIDPTTALKPGASGNMVKQGSGTFPQATGAPQTPIKILGIVLHIAPLQSLEVEIDHTDSTMLQVTSHPTTWSATLIFEDTEKCQIAKELLVTARNQVRSAKMAQIYTLLGEGATDANTPLDSETSESSELDSETEFDKDSKLSTPSRLRHIISNHTPTSNPILQHPPNPLALPSHLPLLTATLEIDKEPFGILPHSSSLPSPRSLSFSGRLNYGGFVTLNIKGTPVNIAESQSPSPRVNNVSASHYEEKHTDPLTNEKIEERNDQVQKNTIVSDSTPKKEELIPPVLVAIKGQILEDIPEEEEDHALSENITNETSNKTSEIEKVEDNSKQSEVVSKENESVVGENVEKVKSSDGVTVTIEQEPVVLVSNGAVDIEEDKVSTSETKESEKENNTTNVDSLAENAPTQTIEEVSTISAHEVTEKKEESEVTEKKEEAIKDEVKVVDIVSEPKEEHRVEVKQEIKESVLEEIKEEESKDEINEEKQESESSLESRGTVDNKQEKEVFLEKIEQTEVVSRASENQDSSQPNNTNEEQITITTSPSIEVNKENEIQSLLSESPLSNTDNQEPTPTQIETTPTIDNTLVTQTELEKEPNITPSNTTIEREEKESEAENNTTNVDSLAESAPTQTIEEVSTISTHEVTEKKEENEVVASTNSQTESVGELTTEVEKDDQSVEVNVIDSSSKEENDQDEDAGDDETETKSNANNNGNNSNKKKGKKKSKRKGRR